MELPKNTIRNPLTIIAIFAGIAEVSGTTVLALLPTDSQRIFLWFVMVFPVLLVGLFFGTLLWKHTVLYAPSDFRSDEPFTGLAKNVQNQTSEQNRQKRQEEFEDLVDRGPAAVHEEVAKKQPILAENAKVEYFLAEELAIKKLAVIYGDEFMQQKAFDIQGSRYTVDGIINTPTQLTVFEIKYFPRLTTPLNGVGRTYKYFKEMFDRIDEAKRRVVGFVVVIVTPIENKEYEQLRNRLAEFSKDSEFHIVFEIWNFNQLKQEFGVE